MEESRGRPAARPPPQICPRCNSDNTKFCYYNNYNVNQPRYFCKNCRRYWTHGGAQRNIPVGGSSRKRKHHKNKNNNNNNNQSTISHQMTYSVQIQPTSTSSQFLGHYRDCSTSYHTSVSAIGTQLGSLPPQQIHQDYVTVVPPIRSFRPVDALNFSQGSYFDVGSNELIGNPLVNQSIDETKWNQSLSNAMNMEFNTSGSRGISETDMNKNNNNKRSFRSSSNCK